MPASASVPSGDAIFSGCGRYRYRLERSWCPDRAPLVWIMLNPSRADADTDDPTIRRCTAFSRAWGYGAMIVVNLYALCATDPDDLRAAADPVGADNDGHIRRVCRPGRRDIVAAWGTHPLARARALRVLSIIAADISCLGLTKTGQPRHPLYVPASQPRLSWHGTTLPPPTPLRRSNDCPCIVE